MHTAPALEIEMKNALLVGMKVIALAFVLFMLFAIASRVLGPLPSTQTHERAGSAALRVVAVCVLDTLVLAHIMLRSRWAGWRLVAAVFVVFYGVVTLMSQIETAVFVTKLPPGVLPRLFLMGALVAAPFSALAVLALGKSKLRALSAEANTRLLMPATEWAWKLVVIALAYLVLYFSAGYFIAWQNPAVREYYGGIDAGGFFAQMALIARDTPWLFALQCLRAMLWTAIALPVIRMLHGRWQETSLSLGLLFSVLMSAQLLLPNPFMPEAVRMSHLLETATSNFAFGCLIGWLLSLRREGAGVPTASGVRSES